MGLHSENQTGMLTGMPMVSQTGTQRGMQRVIRSVRPMETLMGYH